MNRPLFPVFSKRITSELEKQGFQVVRIEPNKKFPNFFVYYFEETVELRHAIQLLIKNK